MLKKFWHTKLNRPFKLHKAYSEGSGQPLLLIHGLATSSNTWEPLIPLLDKNKWRVIAYDLLGFGKSPKPDYMKYDVNEHARAIIASLGRVKNKKIVIIGHSMGCLVASHIAYLRPDMVEHLVLYEPPLFADSPEFRSHSRRRKFYFTLYEYMLQRPSALIKYSGLLSRLVRDRIARIERHEWLPFERSLKNTIMKQQAYTELKHVSVRTDIIYGTFDLIVTRTDVKKMLQSNKNITFHLVKQPHDVTKRAAKFIIKLL